MNKKLIWLIAAKDIRGITSSVQVWLGLILLPLIFSVIFPLAFILLVKNVPISSPDLINLVEKVIEGLSGTKSGDMIGSLPSMKHQIIFVIVNYLLGSIFLLIPTINAMMIALHSFVGEKEKRTMETLLFSPITVKELFIGKVLAALIPSIIITWVSFFLFGVITASLTYKMFGYFIFPNSNWLVLMLLVVPMITILTILVNVFVSARAKGFQEAQQLGGILILPIMALFIGQATGFLIINPYLLALIGVILLILNFILLKMMTKYNDRNTLFEKQI
ncbi:MULTISPECIES: ABC transporter permease subunit [unclassified Bacillus (in: firmicutes)]|uniref:ABC transporter permease subunit n=1 Tax=unclassified Bacillus (in: firmicutes) TaxID=185979 RepID=UPI001BE7E95C|nr:MULTISPECIES: ABC transporter permease subunit [unclassified Bacillus (in: firmicutes)]MBT2638283.1 ABC transporter permease subunit [Bacillus sp. ISL-39]MBT2661361.1 ABC transporter permease subunit [Bacillus sp. ISL-45]